MSAIRTSEARAMAVDRLARIDPAAYAQTRNHLDGAVTQLSPFLRHGVLSLAEVRDAAIAAAGGFSRCSKLIQELAWRDYFQRVWRLLGKRIWTDIEPYKTGLCASDYAKELPADVLAGATGIDYVDHFVRELHATGRLHNHARMWLAAYVVHGRRVQWQAGARWFLSHLLDGDEASNNLSWQWCASTFSHKPYLFNRENVLTFSGNRFATHQSCDPFDESYDAIARKLFPSALVPSEPQRGPDLRTRVDEAEVNERFDPENALVWVHDGMMSPAHPAIALGAKHLFVWDDARLAERRFSEGRQMFLCSALFTPVEEARGKSVCEVLIEAARVGRCSAIVTGDTPDPYLLSIVDQLRETLTVAVIPDRPFVKLSGTIDLARFSRYWAKAQSVLI